MVNGQQMVIQIQGNQYMTWVNGTIAEAGAFQIQGNTMQVFMTTGKMYLQYFQWSPDGTAFSITDPNGVTAVFQRMP